KCIRIRWSGARILNRKRAAEWSGSLTVAGNRIEDVRGFAFDSAGEGIVSWDERGVRWESVTTGDEDGLLLAFERSDRGILEFRTPTASCRVDLVSLREAPFIHSVGGVDQQVVFELAPREEAAPLDLEWKTSVVLRREDALAGAIPLHLRIVQIDGHRAWTSPWFVEV
ncbi:MAG: hypothetical protein NTW86_29710, partial [Candidatus Sumerlaeota bacterium]|nr:hypothetical protein [Candidatus Sumerlaeota bacterium]